jgi:hypothetical protein
VKRIRVPLAIMRGLREPGWGSVERERQNVTRDTLSGRQERGLWDLGLHYVRLVRLPQCGLWDFDRVSVRMLLQSLGGLGGVHLTGDDATKV